MTGSEILLLTTPSNEAPLLKLTPDDGRFITEGGITSLAINSSSSLAVIGGADGGVRVVSLSKGDVIGSLEGHKEGESIEGVAWMEVAGTEVALTAGTDGKICVWDLSTMRLRTTLEHSVRTYFIRAGENTAKLVLRTRLLRYFHIHRHRLIC